LIKDFFSVFETIASPFQAIMNQAVLRWCGKCKVVWVECKMFCWKVGGEDGCNL